MKRYFGNSTFIQEFARELLVAKEMFAANELNRAVKIFGQNINDENVIEKIRRKYKITDPKKKDTSLKNAWSHYKY